MTLCRNLVPLVLVLAPVSGAAAPDLHTSIGTPVRLATAGEHGRSILANTRCPGVDFFADAA